MGTRTVMAPNPWCVRRLRNDRERQPDSDGRSLILSARDGDRSAMLGHDPLASPQAQPRANDTAGHIAATSEALEDMREVTRQDAHTLFSEGEHRVTPGS